MKKLGLGICKIFSDIINRDLNIAVERFEDLLSRPPKESGMSELGWFFHIQGREAAACLIEISHSGNPHHQEIFQRVLEEDRVLRRASWNKIVSFKMESWLENKSEEQKGAILATEGALQAVYWSCKHKMADWLNEQSCDSRKKIVANNENTAWFLEQLGISDDTDKWANGIVSKPVSSNEIESAPA